MENKTLIRVKKMLKPHMKAIFIVSFLSLLVSLGEIINPYLIKIVIDEYLSKNLYTNGIITVSMIGAIYIGIVLLENIIDLIARMATSIIGEDVIYDLRNKLFKYTQYANIPFHDRTPAGKLFVRITNDVEDISTLFKEVVTTVIKDIILIIGIIVIMLIFSIKLSLLTFTVIPFVVFFTGIMTILLNKNILEILEIQDFKKA